MNNPILSAETISAGYDGRKILSDVSLTLPEKKISVILGANGCGKSTHNQILYQSVLCPIGCFQILPKLYDIFPPARSSYQNE